MKTFKTMLTVATVAASLVSCTKQNIISKPEDDMIKITLSGELSQNDQTKIIIGDKTKDGLKQIMKWIDSDEIRFYTWVTATEKVNDHGKFEIADIQEEADEGTGDVYTHATFTGYVLKSALNDTQGCAIYPYQEGMTFDKVANPKFYLTIPTEQDGTGAKYNVLAAKTKPNVFESEEVIGAFNFATAMVKINIPSSYLASKITSVKFEIDPKGDLAGSAFVAGTNCTIQPTSSIAVMNGNSKSVTVAKTEGFITGDVYFTIRPLTNAKFFPIDMKFTFTNKDGKTQTLSKEVSWDSFGIKSGRIYDFGTVTKLTFEGGGGEEKKVDLSLDLNYTGNTNNVLYSLVETTKTYLPTSAPSAEEKVLYFDQNSTTYTFGSYGKLYFFSKTGQTNAKAYGVLLNDGKSYLKLPVIEGYKLATIKGMHGKGSTNDPQKMIATTVEVIDGSEITSGINISFPAAGLEVMGTAVDVESLKEPVYLYCRNVAAPSEKAMSTNTTVIGRLVLGYVKTTK